MREVNFSIPSANKASVGITTALYDRRALDCTSTLPLINSLNHLAYLTTSSARIREILTVDGGVERLVCILKNGRTKDIMDTWKWNLAFQCVVNIGVRGAESRGGESRGSENIRTRVVEADMVPVIATILDNYILVADKIAQEEAELKAGCARLAPRIVYTRPDDRSGSSFGSRSDRRRQAPPPIDTSHSEPSPSRVPPPVSNEEMLDAPVITSSRPESNTPHHHHHHHHHSRPAVEQSQRAVLPAFDATLDTPEAYTGGPSREGHRLPHLRSVMQAGILSQPESPMTPRMTMTLGSSDHVLSDGAVQTRIEQLGRRNSMSGESDDELTGILRANVIPERVVRDDVMVDIQGDVESDGMAAREAVLNAVASEEGPAMATFAPDPDADTFNIARRSMDGSLAESAAAAINPTITFATMQTPFVVAEASPALQAVVPAQMGRSVQSPFQPYLPREEDIILSLQLLAYVSKYCNLRTYFQNSHLVPKLKIGREVEAMENGDVCMDGCGEEVEEENDKEYCQPNNYNIFPLVEKFTVRHHSQDMRYWAGVVMRNLCRKDKSRGDIRQCAYYKCGKWEEYARQFAKCRRCRQTKYCSKDCQKSAWPWHRFWCQQPSQ